MHAYFLPRASTALALTAVLAALGVAACDAPTEPAGLDPADASAGRALEHSGAPFPAWHQGFQHDTDAWYGAGTPGDLGWCGGIERVERGDGDIAPSAGRAHAVVWQDACNTYWDDVYSAPGFTLLGAPWAPGPGFAAIGRPMPESGYEVELDIWLDPAWDAVPLEPGTWVFEEDILGSGTVFAYSVSFLTLTDGAAWYLWVPVWPGDGELLVGAGEHAVTEAGWYTFRHRFHDDGGALAVDFEIEHRDGALVGTEAVDDILFVPGVSPSDFAAADIGTGYSWFTSISPGLELPIDEYGVRPID